MQMSEHDRQLHKFYIRCKNCNFDVMSMWLEAMTIYLKSLLSQSPRLITPRETEEAVAKVP